MLAAWYSQLVCGELKSQGSRIKDQRTRAADLQISLCVLWFHFFFSSSIFDMYIFDMYQVTTLIRLAAKRVMVSL